MDAQTELELMQHQASGRVRKVNFDKLHPTQQLLYKAIKGCIQNELAKGNALKCIELDTKCWAMFKEIMRHAIEEKDLQELIHKNMLLVDNIPIKAGKRSQKIPLYPDYHFESIGEA